MKKLLAALLTAAMAMNPVAASSGSSVLTDEEIEKRINEVGDEYLSYYRQGREEEEDVLYTMNASGQGKAVNTFTPGTLALEEEALTDGDYEEAYSEEVDGYAAEAPGAGLALPGPDVWVDGPFNTEEYSAVEDSGYVAVSTQPFSTFGADVDTASYSSLRRKLLEPFAYDDHPELYSFYGIDDNAIRLEEMMNYFRYHYAEPETGEKFGVSTELTDCPWNGDALLFRVGIKAEDVKSEDVGSNIVFLIDTSGSMFSFDKLPLVKKSLEILLDHMDERDCISVVTYAGSEEVVLDGAPGDDKDAIMEGIDALEAWGSTWGEGGINKAYEIAEKHLIEGGNNRVILCTDGDFNVGVSSEAGLKELISGKRDSGIFFSCLGFGGGNYSDTTMEALADNGNGNYFYIDSIREAERALSEEFFSTVYTVAKDTKFQVEFNPDTVKGYKLIGYVNRKMAAEDFADDTKDGGEVGSGQCVTVLYEVIPADSDYEIPEVESRYGKDKAADNGFSDELMVVNIRYKNPDEDESILREYPVAAADYTEEADPDTVWAAGVAEAGMVMRGTREAEALNDIFDRLKNDPEIMENDYKAEFLFMLRKMAAYKEAE